MNYVPDCDWKNVIEQAEAVVVGIGAEFAVSPEKIAKHTDIYRELSGQMAVDADMEKSGLVPYIINALYANEIKQGMKENVRNPELSAMLEVYEKLSVILRGKQYFIVTTCTDDLIYCSSLDKKNIVAPCGSILRLQKGCDCEPVLSEHPAPVGMEIYEKLYGALVSGSFEEDALKTLIPTCSRCHRPWVPNIHGVSGYDESGYMAQWEKYTKWLQRTLNKRLVLLELGVDFSTPTVIRWPFEKIAMLNYKAMLYRVNEKFWQLPSEIGDKGIAICENAPAFIISQSD